jgi:hypothetical protein
VIPEPEASPTNGPSVDAQSPRPSAAAPIGQLGEAGAMLGSYAGTAERVATAAAEPDSARAPNPPTVVTIGRGDTITRIASRIYGNVGIYELAAIRIANPDIRNLDVVDLGHQVVFPDLQSGLLLSNDDDGGTRALLGATRSLSTARELQAMLERNGVSSEIVADELSDTITAYRLEGRLSPDGPPTTEALDKLSTLRLKLAAYGE